MSSSCLRLNPRRKKNSCCAADGLAPAKLANSCPSGRTREHRRYAEAEIVFHSEDLPLAMENARSTAELFMAQIRRHLNAAKCHNNYFHWWYGVRAWATLKYGADHWTMALQGQHDQGAELPPELAPSNSAWRFRFLRVLRSFRALGGAWPSVPVWRYLWLDTRLIVGWADEIKSHNSNARNLLICSPASPLARYLSRLVPLDVEIDESLTPAGAEQIDIPTGRDKIVDAASVAFFEERSPARGRCTYQNILIHVDRANVRSIRKRINATMPRLSHGGTLGVYAQHMTGSANFSWELAQHVNEVLGTDWLGYHVTAKFAGGAVKHGLRRAETRLARYLVPSSFARIPLMIFPIILLPPIAILTTANNLRLRDKLDLCPDFCSSMLLSLTKAVSKTRFAGDAATVTGIFPAGSSSSAPAYDAVLIKNVGA